MKTILIAVCTVATSSFAECPPEQDITAQMDALIAQAQTAPNDAVGQDVSGQMWQLWLRAPDEAAQEILDRGMLARSGYDFLGAVEAFSLLIEYCPSYAEGYNQRAFAYFLQQDFSLALQDLDQALERSPRHVGALSGRALTLMNLGRISEARMQLLTALEINTWLSERFLLNKGGPLADVGEEI